MQNGNISVCFTEASTSHLLCVCNIRDSETYGAAVVCNRRAGIKLCTSIQKGVEEIESIVSLTCFSAFEFIVAQNDEEIRAFGSQRLHHIVMEILPAFRVQNPTGSQN